MSAGSAVVVRRVGAEAAEEMLEVIRGAFADRPPLDPPADALAETVESLARRLDRARGLLALLDGHPVGSAVLDPQDDVLYLRRFGVLPQAQGRGVAGSLVQAAVAAGAAQQEIGVLARTELPATVEFWHAAGFTRSGGEAPYVRLSRALPTVHRVPDAEAMQDLGRRVGALLEAGDLLVLTGALGAGKTTFTQGVGEGLGVRGGVTSPTFVIARVHPSLVDGPDLVHVDAYRLGGVEELDDLDLDTSLAQAVTVVEWGEGLSEGLAERRLHVRIGRALGADGSDRSSGAELAAEDDPREVELQWHRQ